MVMKCLPVRNRRLAVSMSGWSNLKQSLIDEDRKRVEPTFDSPHADNGMRGEAIAG